MEGAELEINTAAKTLFDSGAEKVIVWDFHLCYVGGTNVPFEARRNRDKGLRYVVAAKNLEL